MWYCKCHGMFLTCAPLLPLNLKFNLSIKHQPFYWFLLPICRSLHALYLIAFMVIHSCISNGYSRVHVYVRLHTGFMIEYKDWKTIELMLLDKQNLVPLKYWLNIEFICFSFECCIHTEKVWWWWWTFLSMRHLSARLLCIRCTIHHHCHWKQHFLFTQRRNQ